MFIYNMIIYISEIFLEIVFTFNPLIPGGNKKVTHT